MFLNYRKSVQARLVGDTLVASFRNSNPNLIWKFDLERNHSFTLALQGEDGDLELGVTSSKGEFYPVARFSTREDAEEAFAAVQKVLMKRRYGRFTRALITIGGIVLVITAALYIYHAVSSLFSPGPHASSPVSAAVPQGVPVPADQVLRPP